MEKLTPHTKNVLNALKTLKSECNKGCDGCTIGKTMDVQNDEECPLYATVPAYYEPWEFVGGKK